eukprot:tig00001302_g8100.t1
MPCLSAGKSAAPTFLESAGEDTLQFVRSVLESSGRAWEEFQTAPPPQAHFEGHLLTRQIRDAEALAQLEDELSAARTAEQLAQQARAEAEGKLRALEERHASDMTKTASAVEESLALMEQRTEENRALKAQVQSLTERLERAEGRGAEAERELRGLREVYRLLQTMPEVAERIERTRREQRASVPLPEPGSDRPSPAALLAVPALPPHGTGLSAVTGELEKTRRQLQGAQQRAADLQVKAERIAEENGRLRVALASHARRSEAKARPPRAARRCAPDPRSSAGCGADDGAGGARAAVEALQAEQRRAAEAAAGQARYVARLESNLLALGRRLQRRQIRAAQRAARASGDPTSGPPGCPRPAALRRLRRRERQRRAGRQRRRRAGRAGGAAHEQGRAGAVAAEGGGGGAGGEGLGARERRERELDRLRAAVASLSPAPPGPQPAGPSGLEEEEERVHLSRLRNDLHRVSREIERSVESLRASAGAGAGGEGAARGAGASAARAGRRRRRRGAGRKGKGKKWGPDATTALYKHHAVRPAAPPRRGTSRRAALLRPGPASSSRSPRRQPSRSPSPEAGPGPRANLGAEFAWLEGPGTAWFGTEGEGRPRPRGGAPSPATLAEMPPGGARSRSSSRSPLRPSPSEPPFLPGGRQWGGALPMVRRADPPPWAFV